MSNFIIIIWYFLIPSISFFNKTVFKAYLKFFYFRFWKFFYWALENFSSLKLLEIIIYVICWNESRFDIRIIFNSDKKLKSHFCRLTHNYQTFNEIKFTIWQVQVIKNLVDYQLINFFCNLQRDKKLIEIDLK